MVAAGAIALLLGMAATATLGSLIVLAVAFMLPSASGDAAAFILLALVVAIFGIVFTIVFRDLFERFST